MINCADCVLRLLKYFMVVIEWSRIALIMIVKGNTGSDMLLFLCCLYIFILLFFTFVSPFAVLVEENTSKTKMCIY